MKISKLPFQSKLFNNAVHVMKNTDIIRDQHITKACQIWFSSNDADVEIYKRWQMLIHLEIILTFWLHVKCSPSSKMPCEVWKMDISDRDGEVLFSHKLLECCVMTKAACKTKLLLLEYCHESLWCEPWTGSRPGSPHTHQKFTNAGLWEITRIGAPWRLFSKINGLHVRHHLCSLKRKLCKKIT